MAMMRTAPMHMADTTQMHMADMTQMRMERTTLMVKQHTTQTLMEEPISKDNTRRTMMITLRSIINNKMLPNTTSNNNSNNSHHDNNPHGMGRSGMAVKRIELIIHSNIDALLSPCRVILSQRFKGFSSCSLSIQM